MTPKDRYKNDWLYHQLTDLLKKLMDDGEMSPTDVIQAARLACEMHFNDAAVPLPHVQNREEIHEKFEKMVDIRKML